MPFITNPPSVSDTWDSVSDVKSIPFGLVTSVLFNFPHHGTVAMSDVYIECVVDDHGDATKNFGQYNVGDRVKCPTLVVINNGSTVKVVNPWGSTISMPRSNGGSKSTKLSSTFTIDSTNSNKYKLRCFASHSKQPLFSSRRSYFDKVIKLTSAQIKSQLSKDKYLKIPHTLSGTPWIVEINFIVVTAKYGYEVGRVVPLKFIGGSQSTVSSPYTQGVWTTSADATNVYLGSSSGCIAIASLDGKGTMFNIFSDGMFDMQICVKKDYPNPYHATFTQKDFKTPATMVSETIPHYPHCGEVTDYDLVICNNKSGGKTAYGKGEFIFLSQSGGSYSPQYLEVSQAQFFDPVKRLLKFVINAPEKGKSQLAMYDRKTNKYFDVVEDNKLSDTEWTYIFRWKYDNCDTPYDIDTGWINQDQYALNYPKGKFLSDSLNINDKVQKLDIFWRASIDLDNLGLNALSSISLSSLKGDAQANDMSRKANRNNFNVSYNNKTLDISSAVPNNIMTIPNYLLKGKPPLSGLIFTGGSGFSEIRICGYNEGS